MAFNGRFVLRLAHFAARQGGDFDTLVKLSGKSVDELSAEYCIVEDESYNKLIENAIENCQDPYLGLHFGESQHLSAYGLVAQITQTSSTIKEALEFACQFSNLGCSALPMQLQSLDNHYRLLFTPNPLWLEQSPIAVQHTTTGFITFAVKQFQSLTREQHRPIAIHFPWKMQAGLAEYERIFNCPIRFQQPEIAILLHKAQVEDRILSSNYKLLRVLVAHAEAQLALIKQQGGFAAIVKQSMVNLVKPAFPTVEQVASHLNISARTLQRRLQEEGSTFKGIMDELRKDFAIAYLKRIDLSISEIAYLLSYSDSSAFTRSFRRWTGQSPKAFRSETIA